MTLANNAVEQTASASRPWQAAQGDSGVLRGPRPVPRPPLLTASVRQPARSLPLHRTLWLGAIGSILLLISMPAGSAAGECTDTLDHYISIIEQLATGVSSPHRGAVADAFWCLSCYTDDWSRWAGPNAAAQFADCRQGPIRDRILAACAPLLDDTPFTSDDGFVPRYAAARLLACRGIQRVDQHDIFKIITQEIRARRALGTTDFMSLAVLQDKRTLRFLSAAYDSLCALQSAGHTNDVCDILNCLYHVPGDSALLLAKRIDENESDPSIRERASRVVRRE